MPALSYPCLCLVTDRHQCDGRPLEEVVAQAVEAGAGMVQLREKDLPAGQLLGLATRLRDITRGKALLFINDRVDVALACGADGVQLGEDALPVAAARRVAGGRLLLGRSVHSADGAVAAESDGADLLVVGTIFATGSHPGAATGGVKLLEEVSGRVRVPFLAIGGVNAGNIGSVIQAGAWVAAVITAITRAADPGHASGELVSRMSYAWQSTHKGRLAKHA